MTKANLLKFAKMLKCFSEIQTDNGLLVADTEMAVGVEVFIEKDGNLVPAPDGEYKTDGKTYTVEAGVITAIEEAQTDPEPEPEPEPAPEPEPMADDPEPEPEPEPAEPDEKDNEIADLKKQIEDLTNQIADKDAQIAELQAKLDETEPSIEDEKKFKRQNHTERAAQNISRLAKAWQK